MYVHTCTRILSLTVLSDNTIIISRNRYIKLSLGETRLVAFDATREGDLPRKFDFSSFLFSPRDSLWREKKNENDNTWEYKRSLVKFSNASVIDDNVAMYSSDKEKKRKFFDVAFRIAFTIRKIFVSKFMWSPVITRIVALNLNPIRFLFAKRSNV